MVIREFPGQGGLARFAEFTRMLLSIVNDCMSARKRYSLRVL